MDYIFDWQADGDRFSFEDSDRFEEDSLCSWTSEPESLCNNWRGWRKQNNGGAGGAGSGAPATAGGASGGLLVPGGVSVGVVGSTGNAAGNGTNVGTATGNETLVTSLLDLSAQVVARYLPFEVVEHHYQPIPEQLQLRIAFWSFPENEEDIRLYSCLANGSSDEFQKGETLFRNKSVHDALQIGFHLSATLTPPFNPSQVKGSYNVALVFDRRHITSCMCSCSPSGSIASWCAHVVALCLFRIHQPKQVCLRAPVSESLSRLERDQLQKFAQYLISELPQQILPTAQRLLDQLLSSQKTMINAVCGAPDPTAGPSAGEQTAWCLDEATLHENIKKTLVKFCVPSPVVLSDVNYLSNNAPPAANEWQSLLRPLRGREPEGIWNLLLIVREMFRRSDNNAIPLLEILTEEILACEQIVIWWFNNKTQMSNSLHNNRNINQNNSSSSQHAASSLCDEIVTLWRLATLNPALSSSQRAGLCSQLKDWHVATAEKLRKPRSTNGINLLTQPAIKESDIDAFTGFKTAIEACQLEWSDLLPVGCTRRSCGWLGFLSRVRGDGDGSRITHAKGYWKSPVSCSVNVTDGVNPMHGLGQALTAKWMEGEPGSGNQQRGVRSSGLRRFGDGKGSDTLNTAENHRRSSGGDLECVASPEKNSPGKSEDSPGKSEDADSDCGSLPSTPRCPAAGSNKDSPNGSTPGLNISNGEVADTVLEYGKLVSARNSREESVSIAKDASPQEDTGKPDKTKSKEQNYFAGVKKPANKQEIMFALAEALHAHGHVFDACQLAKELTEDMLNLAPDVVADHIAGKGEKKKRTLLYNSATLSDAYFLCSVLLEDAECRHLAFRIGLFGLEMARLPAASKSLEVKLAHQESELVILLKKIPIGTEELTIIRDRAEKLRDRKLKSRGEALLPVVLASFIFDSLCLPTNKSNVASCGTRPGMLLTAADERLGFEAAVSALGLKANVSEAEHPLLCEGTRRQKGELAVAMLVHYKDDSQKLARIMDTLLDKEVYQLYKNPQMSGYSVGAGSSAGNCFSISDAAGLGAVGDAAMASARRSQNQESVPSPAAVEAKDNVSAVTKREQVSAGGSEELETCRTVALKAPTGPVMNSKDTDSSALEEDTEGSSDYKAWEAKFRCANLRTAKKPSVGMASVDSSAPETTSSDNSPTLVRRGMTGHHGVVHNGPGSDSGSSQKSSDSSGCDFQGALTSHDIDSPLSTSDGVVPLPVNFVYSRSSTPNVKGIRYKGKNRAMPVVPNQPSEASSHFMFELAKTVLIKAGGSSSTSLFVNQSATGNANPTGTHRALHLCAFQIGLHALGLNNFVSPNWLSRTYSSHVSWITGQATEIGYPAINIMIRTWEGHLTPQEVASLSDRASRCRDPNMVRAAAELALSCLPHAHALNPNEIGRALVQCKEQSKDMLERACLSVEMTAKEGQVYPEVLFEVAKRWYELYEETLHGPLQPVAPAFGSVDRGVGQPGSQRSAENVSAGAPGGISVVHVVRDQSGPGLMNPGSLMAAAPLCPPGSNGIFPADGSLPISPMSYALPTGQQFQVVHPFLAPPYAYVQPITPPNFSHYYSIQSPHIRHFQQMHLAKYAYPGQPPPYVPSNVGASFHPALLRPPPFPPVAFVSSPSSGVPQQPGGGSGIANWGQAYAILQPVDGGAQALSSVAAPPGSQHGARPQHVAAPPSVPLDVALSNPGQINYLLAAYRVGMLAMETLARRVHDDRPQVKFARNPPYGEDVKWLHTIAMKLGASYLQQFCASVCTTIVSPFILLDIAMESAKFLSGNSVSQIPQQLHQPMLSSLLQRCLQMFVQCTHSRIHHITQADHDEFISIVCSARNAFCMTPDGLTQFNEMLQGLRRSKSCKRELWQRIIGALHNSSSI